MPALLFGTGLYKRTYGNLPVLRCVNFFAESAPTAENQVVLQSRKGLATSVTRGAGPINGIFSRKGVFNGDKFVISNNTLYREGSSLGTISGTGPISWAASSTELVVTRGTTAYSYNGTNLQAIAFPDGANVKAVECIDGLFLFIKANSQRWYWSTLDDARTIDPLDFASAELLPDNLLDMKAVRGSLYLFGEESIERWYPNGGNVDLPFIRVDQSLFSKGIVATGCVSEVDQILVFLGHDGAVYRISDGPERISHHGIEEQIRASTAKSTFSFSYDGHHFFCVRLDTTTYCWDAITNQWCEFASYGRTNWRAKCATNVGAIPYFGDDETNDVWVFGTVFKDDDGALEGYFTALTPISGGDMPFDVIEVHANVGQTQPLSGDDASPVMEMRTSRDGGNTFGDWKEATLGAQGEYRARARWRRCGYFGSPGFYAEYRVTDQSPRRISAVYYNEAGGGRSR